jgi:hypothetical protein
VGVTGGGVDVGDERVDEGRRVAGDVGDAPGVDKLGVLLVGA